MTYLPVILLFQDMESTIARMLGLASVFKPRNGHFSCDVIDTCGREEPPETIERRADNAVSSN